MMRRTWITSGVLVCVVASVVLILGAFGSASGVSAVVGIKTGSPTASPSAIAEIASGPTLTPSPTVPRFITATATSSPLPPTATFVPTETPSWREHTVKAGESCFEIAADYGHLDPASVYAIQDLNGIRCSALQQGAVIKVPLPTPTATQVGMDLTQTAVATSAPPQMLLEVGGSIAVQDYIVVSGDTLLSVADKNSSSMRQICELNPLPEGLNCGSCQWTGPNCCCSPAPLVVVGQRLNVPAPSPTPTASPTFTGSETPTLTPTYRAPEPVMPRDGASVQGAVRLAWISVGVLQDDERYYVQVTDEISGTAFETATSQLSLDVPLDLLPNDGQTHHFTWQVQVVRLSEGAYFLPISQVVSAQGFEWQGW